MQNLFTILKKEIFPISLILILAFARLIPHPPNFTPIIAVAIVSGYFFKNINLSLLTLLIAMLISDLFIKYNLWNTYNLFFDINNILDEKYETVRDYSQMDRSFNFGIRRVY